MMAWSRRLPLARPSAGVQLAEGQLSLAPGDLVIRLGLGGEIELAQAQGRQTSSLGVIWMALVVVKSLLKGQYVIGTGCGGCRCTGLALTATRLTGFGPELMQPED